MNATSNLRDTLSKIIDLCGEHNLNVEFHPSGSLEIWSDDIEDLSTVWWGPSEEES